MNTFNDLTDTEFEAKFYPVNKKDYRAKLKKIGAKLVIPERKMRRAIVQRKVYPQLKCDYIRVRDEGSVIRISAKTHPGESGVLSDQKEIDIEVSDYDKAVRLIEMMGFVFTTYQETLRETWSYKGAEITIDTWPGLLTYSEVEAPSEEQVKAVAKELDLDWNKKIITSATEIFMKTYHLSEDEAIKELKHLTFEDNPFTKLIPDNSWI